MIDLRLILGKESYDGSGIDPITEGESLKGHKTTFLERVRAFIEGKPVLASYATLGLFLENDGDRPARRVRLNLSVSDSEKCRWLPILLKYGVGVTTIRNEAISLQFSDDLVVYPGFGSFLGKIRLSWPKGVRPARVTLAADIHNLDTGVKSVEIPVEIRWANEED